MLASLIILILPVYFTVDQLVSKLGNAQVYMQKFNIFLEKIHQFIFQKVGFDILSKENIAKVTNFAGTFSTKALSTTVNTFTVVISMYFVLYFMFVKPDYLKEWQREPCLLKGLTRKCWAISL
jgi:predicted PurR-regulated permease PerM